jgi:hypothetical protein
MVFMPRALNNFSSLCECYFYTHNPCNKQNVTAGCPYHVRLTDTWPEKVACEVQSAMIKGKYSIYVCRLNKQWRDGCFTYCLEE